MSAPRLRKLYSQSGFTLVELMVALVLGLILTGGVINIYISSKQTYRMQDNQSRLQENGRFALQFLAKDLRMAGYMGCTNLAALTPNIIANSPPMTSLFDPSTVIQGYDSGTWPSTFPAEPANLVAGNSVIVVQYALPSGIFVFDHTSLTADLKINANPYNWTAGTILFVTDCQSADVFRATTVSISSGKVNIAHASSQNTSNNLSKIYKPNSAQVMAFVYYMYYIGSMSGGTTCPCALYRQSVTGTNDQMVDNIQGMQITYGVDTTNDQNADRYLTASAVTNGSYWPSVVSARVNLLATTPDDNLVDKPQVYTYNGAPPAPAADRRLYSSFTDTITFRNRAP